jgi:hypothetical protein
MTTSIPTETDPRAEQRRGYIAGLRALADLLEQNPDLYSYFGLTLEKLLIPVSHADDPRAALAAFLRAGKAAGLRVSKAYDENFGSVDVYLSDALRAHVYAGREQVCERVVVGSREVTREVPDPEALKAVPTTTVIETVEDVRWECRPLLAAGEAADDLDLALVVHSEKATA